MAFNQPDALAMLEKRIDKLENDAKVRDKAAKVRDRAAKVRDKAAKVRDQAAKVRDQAAKVRVDGLVKAVEEDVTGFDERLAAIDAGVLHRHLELSHFSTTIVDTLTSNVAYCREWIGELRSKIGEHALSEMVVGPTSTFSKKDVKDRMDQV